MAFNAIITITNFGSEVGPFDVFSDVDNYIVPFETNIPLSAMTSGFYTPNVPDGTINVKIKSNGDCINFIIIPVQFSPSPSVTPSNTPSETPILTPSLTASVTPTITPSPTETPILTPSVTPSTTPTITPTQTLTPTNTSTPTMTPSGSGAIVCYNYSNNTVSNWTGDYVDCNGTPFSGAVLTPGQSICAQSGTVVNSIGGPLTQGSQCNP